MFIALKVIKDRAAINGKHRVKTEEACTIKNLIKILCTP